MLKKIEKDIPIIPPHLALWLTLISSNYPCLEHIFMVHKVFKPLKFYYIFSYAEDINEEEKQPGKDKCKNLKDLKFCSYREWQITL